VCVGALTHQAPYSYTVTNSSGATTGAANSLSKGLWKSVYGLRNVSVRADPNPELSESCNL
jgi:hypothetical protein